MSIETRAESILSLNPSVLFDDDSEYRHLCRLFEKQFGGVIFGPSKKTVTFASKRSARRLSHLNPFRKTGYTEVYQNKNGIKITLDVQQFKVGEVTVKVADQCVIIEGKHKDRRDYHGFISRSFTRQFFLPKTMDPSTLSAKLSLDGILTVTALSKELPAPRVRMIDICCTRKRAFTASITNKGAAKPSVKPIAKLTTKPAFKPGAKAGVQQGSKPGSKPVKAVRVDRDVKPQPMPQRSTTKPKASGSAKPQKQSKNAQ